MVTGIDRPGEPLQCEPPTQGSDNAVVIKPAQRQQNMEGNGGGSGRQQPGRGARGNTSSLAIGLSLLLAMGAGGCAGRSETPLSQAKPGDVLTRREGATVQLARTFRQAEPNALLDGAVRVRQEGGGEHLLEVNAVCSLPGTPGWPAYDNIYGRPISTVDQAKGTTGTTEWQVLFPFAGGEEVRMGRNPGPWLTRLRDNLCRRGDFDDRPAKVRQRQG